ncbi:DUF2207 domain-containing protein [Pseudoroseicyclus tamaricis]|uniref:DUF2207 domain-containing protein n=1 Tax=Pseudoroseicyclus tamaricis TaxID=2705421 RepID=A0A6B2K1G4_9RHOB|nr:DUF2207 domain-containing protein [Pseudoroseicyclus tamaricis]NDV00196.1 DUF2207 domain-containing protein [Pseudoroseicyclus tamaricis]
MNATLRKVHRWCSVLFTLGFLINVGAIFLAGEPATWVYFTALLPLFILFPSGLYLFARPYLLGRRTA